MITRKNARLNEGLKDNEKAFENWVNVSIQINEFEDQFFKQHSKIEWAKKHSYLRITKEFVVGLIAGVISSGIVTLLYYLLF